MSMQWMEAGDRSRVPWWAPIASELRTAIRCQQRRGPRRGGERGRGDEEISSSGGGRQDARDRSAAVGQVLVEQDGQQIVMLHSRDWRLPRCWSRRSSAVGEGALPPIGDER